MGDLIINDDLLIVFKVVDWLYIVVVGISYYVGLVGVKLFELLVNVLIEVYVFLEFVYN